ncbi:hypothetical protein [Leptolyngbya sp. BC1307]|uniref:hypothetical protein n=1 Tax=Leptolyngbya sp. BC1307 TaxID=2029589 RepID=UPI000EFD1015|nr:hypothetical protein [Leptolyngbya sp. BC1307]
MPFTIRPDAAQAMQEDEAQLISAIAQVAQRVPAVLRLAANNSTSNARGDSLRIKMGRRLVYGQLADGPFRHELDANSLKVIADALQRPVTPDVDPSKYANKVPAVEIFQGDVLLFREERDGTVTTNEIQFQVEQESQTKQENQAKQKKQIAPAPAKQNEPEQASPPVYVANPAAIENTFTVSKADQILRTAEYLINPLRQQEGMYDAVSVQGYQIKQSDQHITVSQGERLILVARGGEIMSDQVTERDWAALSQIQMPERFPQTALDAVQPQISLPKAALDAARSSHATNGTVPSQTQNGAVPSQTQIVEPIKQVVEATGSQPAAFSVLERETQKLPEGYARELLQATIQDWKQQVGQWLSTKPQQGTSWLKGQQSALQNQRLASAVQQIFQRGHGRTGEHSYRVKGCTITCKDQNLYVLKDAAGELMKFKTSKFLGLGRRLEVFSVSDRLTSEQRQGFLTAQSNRTFSPQSSLDVEAAYAQKTRQVENTSRHFLKNFAFAKSWSKEGGQFKIEIGEGDLLRISDKQNGRGVVFQRQNGEVFSKLNGQDFEHFDRLASKMQGMAPSQGQPATNNSKKVTAIEMD